MTKSEFITLLLMIALVIAASISFIPVQTVLSTIIAMILFCLPGVIVAHFIPLGGYDSPLFRLAFIQVIGFTCSTLTSVLVLCFAPLFTIAFFVPVIITIGILLALKTRQEKPSLITNDLKSQLFLFTILSLIIFILTIPPFMKIGYQFPEGEAYRAYFNGDYIKHVAITAHLTHTSFPPDNPYLHSPEKFHYYWFFYVFPATVKVLFSPYMSIETIDILLVVSIWQNCIFLLLFIGLFYSLSKQVIGTAFILLCGFCAYSYEGLYIAHKIHTQGRTLFQGLGEFNIDAATRWFIGHPQIDGFYRTLLFTPQHLFALSQFLIALILVPKLLRSANGSLRTVLFYGVLVGTIFGFSSFIGLVAALWFMTYLFITTVITRKPGYLISSGLTLSLVFGFQWYLGILFTRGGSLIFEPQYPVLAKLPTFLILNFGPLILLAPLGILFSFKRDRSESITMLSLLAVCFFLTLFVQVKNFASDMGLKLGLIINFILMYYGIHLFIRFKKSILKCAIPLGILMLPAFPTVLLDEWNSSDVNNTRFTSVITKDERAACEWIKAHIPTTAIFQSEPFNRGFYSIIPTFAERRVFLGDLMHARIFLGDENAFETRKHLVEDIYKQSDCKRKQELLLSNNIDYVFVSTIERAAFPEGLVSFLNFVCPYRNETVSIYSHDQIAQLNAVSIERLSANKELRTLNCTVTSNDSLRSHSFILHSDLSLKNAPDITASLVTQFSLNAKESKTISLDLPDMQFPAGEYEYRGTLSHQTDEQDRVTPLDFSVVEFFKRFHTTGSIGSDNKHTWVFAEAPKDKSGILVRGELGILPPGHYSLIFPLATSESVDQILEIKLFSGVSPVITANSTILSESPLTISKKVEFTLEEFKLVKMELLYNGIGTLKAFDFTLHYDAPASTAIPLQQHTDRIFVE